MFACDVHDARSALLVVETRNHTPYSTRRGGMEMTSAL